MWLSSRSLVIIFLAIYDSISLSTPLTRAADASSGFYGHRASYVDTRFQKGAHKALNHEFYRHRKAVPSPVPAIASADTPQNRVLEVAPASAIPKHVATPETDISAWKNQTHVACLRALMAAHDAQPNLSGIAPCYNIPFFDSSTGSFTADLRLYAVSLPSDDWAFAEIQDMSVGISFAGAKFATPSPRHRKRGLESTPLAMTYEPQAVSTRVIIVIPRYIRDLGFHGKITDYTSGGDVDPRALRLLVTPNITLSGTTRQGIGISTHLSLGKACFVNGLFIKPNVSKDPPVSQASAAVIASEEMVPVWSGSTFKNFPGGLIVTSLWASLYIAVTGHGVLRRIQARNHYRNRIQRSKSSGFGHN